MESSLFDSLFSGYNVIFLVVALIAPGIVYAFYYAFQSVQQDRVVRRMRYKSFNETLIMYEELLRHAPPRDAFMLLKDLLGRYETLSGQGSQESELNRLRDQIRAIFDKEISALRREKA